jgi:hypothetical protein
MLPKPSDPSAVLKYPTIVGVLFPSGDWALLDQLYWKEHI